LNTQTVAQAAPIPPPRDIPYPGMLSLHVDATDLDRRIFRVHESVPVQPGDLTLFYPKWLPGVHAPGGPIEDLAGLVITAAGERINWTRDSLDVYAFHLRVPPHIKALDLEFQFVSPQRPAPNARVVVTPEILGVEWNTVLLYPAGYYVSRIAVAASLMLPSGWSYATALTTDRSEGGTVHFHTTSIETLVDSPLFAGVHFARVDLDPGANPPVHLDIFADSVDELDVTPERIALHRKLMQEAYQLFGSRHFDHYDFLLSISDNFGTTGLEHHRSSEDAVRRGYFKDWDKTAPGRYILPHELAHSWNGKFRRPAGLWTPNYNVPMQDDLLWVYEGQTNYWDRVLIARSGLWSEEFARASLASIAATSQDKRQGRAWRDLQDTTNQPVISHYRPQSWVSWERGQDYYNESVLLWLDADTKIRELTAGKRSLDDFARAFFGIDNGSYVPVTYTFDDVVRALNAIAPNDWAGFLRTRLDSHGPNAPLDGLTRAGWKLAFKEEPSEFLKKLDQANEATDLTYSIGLAVDKDAHITEVVWDSPAFKAGLTTAGTVVAVNGRVFTPDLLKQAVQGARDAKSPVELLVRSLDRFRTVRLDYSGGLRYPYLERIPNTEDRLAAILKPRRAAP
ncbi:MAG: M61 family metallopeptidase, partial [Steroidobacteraceae bacterium]